MCPQILLVEDDPRTAQLTADYLRSQGFEVTVETQGSDAVARIVREQPDLVLLDWMLPGEDGLSICRRIRPRYRGPVLMLTARGDPVDQIVGLEMGADDYVAKPAEPRVLLARIRALLRRTAPDVDDVSRLTLGDLVVDRATRAAHVAGVAVPLSTAEFDLLWLLAQNAGSPLDRETLFEALRGIAYDGLDRSMDMRVSTVRKALRDTDPHSRDWIVTVRGVGYQLVRGPR